MIKYNSEQIKTKKKKMIILIYEYNIIFSWLIISDLKSQKVFKINFLTKIGNESK